MPKAQTITVKARGLYDSGNNPWTLPDGALTEATNVEIGRDNVIKPRLGWETLYTVTSHYLIGLFGTYVVGQQSTTLRYSSDAGATWAGAATVPWSGLPRRSAQAATSLFVAATTGVFSLDVVTGTPIAAGVAGALDLSAVVAGAGTAIPNNTQVAYRAVFGRRDANGRVLLGAPSSRVVLKNTAGSVQNATVVVTIPSEVQSSTFFVQLYRTGASVDVNTDPGDECYLVYELTLGASATATITDTTPDGLGGASLYTNPSQETILGGNERPPLAYDLAEFGGSMWYADTTTPARQTIYLLGVSGTNGLALNDTITVNGQVFTAKAAEVVASREFLLATAGTTDENVRATTASLIKCINRTTAANAFAIDLSEPYPAGIPGVISIRRTDFTSNLTLAVSKAAAWANIVATTVPVRNKNGLMYSKTDQPDQIATAIYNAPIRLGSAVEPVTRIIPTRNSLWVLKSDGVWRVTGSAGQFEVQPFDPTALIVAANSAVALDNQVYFLSDQGFMRLSESGTELISRPIEAMVQSQLPYASYAAAAIAVAREADHKYLVGSINYSPWSFEFDTLTNSWTGGLGTGVGFRPYLGAALVEPDSKRVLWRESALYLVRSARPEDAVAYADKIGTFTLSGTPVDIGGGQYSIAVSAADAPAALYPLAGNLIHQGGRTAVLVSFLTGPNRIVVSDIVSPGSWTAAVADVAMPFTATTTWATKCPTPGTSCEWQEAAILLGTVSADPATITFTGDYGSDPALTVPKTEVGATKQIRAWPGRTSSFSGTMKVKYSETVRQLTTPTEIGGIVWTVSPEGDGVSR